MKNYKNSSYAANKYSKDIVYNSEVSGTTSITLEDFLKSDPTLTEADFERWKNWSDLDYEAEAKATNRCTKKNISFSNLVDSLSSCGLSTEEYYEEKETELKYRKAMHEAMNLFLKKSYATEKMKQRFIMYYVDGMLPREIAKACHVNRPAVYDSLNASMRIFKSLFLSCLNKD